MRILVVGGTGFIGEHLCRELVERGHEVTALSRNPEDGDLPTGVEAVMGDVTAYDSIEAAFEGQDAVMNLVALSPLFRPTGGNDMHFEVHRDGTANVVRAAETHGVEKLVQMSALGASPDANTAYIQSKGLAEAIVTDSDLEWVIVRPSVIFGEGEEFIPYTKLLATPYLTPLPGGGKTRFQPIWIGDIVPMLADALEGRPPERDRDADEPAAELEGELEDELEGELEGELEEESVAGPNDESMPEEADIGVDAVEEPHVGQIYEIGGPEVLTLAEVATLAHAADNKPVDVISIPMPLAGFGLKTLDYVPVSVLDAIPGVPRMGSDQYRSLKFDNTTDDNDIAAFGVSVDELTTVSEYLGVSLDEEEA